MAPEAFFGHPIGADYHLTTYEKAMEWFDHLASHSGGTDGRHGHGHNGDGPASPLRRHLVRREHGAVGRVPDGRPGG